MRNPVILLLLSSLLLIACDRRTTYAHYEPVPVMGWHQDSVLTYDFVISDTTATYTMLVNVRHTETYPYQNMWLFVENDTIEFYLADERGRWLGNGRNSLIEMPVLYEQEVTFPHAGNYTIHIAHAMRDSLLRGISDVGFVVKRSNP